MLNVIVQYLNSCIIKIFLSLCTGNRSVCVNAATMALIDAGIPMRDFVCASSASFIEDTPMLGIYTCALLYMHKACTCACFGENFV